MAFNGKLYQQERLSKEDVQLLRKALDVAIHTGSFNAPETVLFLAKKLERMEKAFRS